ncbi:MAG: glycosyltransferase involved in cell wall biosynthesis [Planctomycetota bacterium]
MRRALPYPLGHVKVLFLVTDDWYFLSHRVALARAARDAGCQVVVATRDGGKLADIEAEGFEVRELCFSRRVGDQVRNLALLRRLTRLYREVKPDLVHHVSFLPIFYGTLAARRAGVPSIVNAVTGLGHAFVDGGVRRRLLRWSVERAYARVLRGPGVRVLVQNKEDRDHLVSRGLAEADDITLVPGSGVNTDRFRQRPEALDGAAPLIVHASRMLWSKGVGDTVKAVESLRQEGMPLRLVLAGRTHPDNPRSISESKLGEWSAQGIAQWIGETEDMPGLLERASILTLPSVYREGVPMVLLEAAAAGRPIVTTDVPGCRDAVVDGENGYLVPPSNPEAIAEALGKLLRDPELRRRMGERGRRRVIERFSEEIVIRRTLGVYRELVGDTWPHILAPHLQHDSVAQPSKSLES